ncbi:restriction endonuclease subunit S [Paracnuella aquatica]|uniref:restriction endonuclease subunit S n=1 Tax=Paracnuella aquatica TaxID=2268757 RepID=UPI0013902D70|nr:restriction endonuclease subunit S [Paracnuella aquatica]
MIEELIIKAPFDLKQIDKSDWQTFRFDQIALNISERVEPQKTDLDMYVGLEHLDSESIYIKRWGTPSDVEGTKLKVYPGDVIFGKRRAYQRKAALATFEGICSAHAMVLRPNPKVIEPDLFPFFLHSDAFMHRAVNISVGSLSPTINWKTLAVQEFLLPPKEQQAKLAELLWAVNEVVERDKELKSGFDLVRTCFIEKLFTNTRHDKYHSPKWTQYKIEELAEFRRGSFPQPYGLPEWYDDKNGFPFVQVYDIDFNMRLKERTKFKISKKAAENSVFVPEGSLIISIQGSIGRLAITQYDAYVDRTVLIFTKYLIEINQIFFAHILFRLFEEKEKSARGATIKTITKEELSKFTVAIPEIEEQNRIARTLEKLSNTSDQIIGKLNCSLALQRSLINQIFS